VVQGDVDSVVEEDRYPAKQAGRLKWHFSRIEDCACGRRRMAIAEDINRTTQTMQALEH
jgi:hypothetical protein